MNVEIGAEAAQFPEKEYINGIDLAVWTHMKFTMVNPNKIKYEFYATIYRSPLHVLDDWKIRHEDKSGQAQAGQYNGQTRRLLHPEQDKQM
jgi:hypothetical protein